MANSTSIQVLLDGSRNASIKVEGLLDTSDLGSTVIADPATLAGIDNTLARKASTFRIKRITYNIEPGLTAILTWDGATPARIEELNGTEDSSFDAFGGLTNNAVTPNGKILLSTKGWSGVKSYSIILELTKVS